MNSNTMVEKEHIYIAEDFSLYPAGRFLDDGPFSGEKLRKEFLVPSLKTFPSVTVRIDGVKGYGSSFLEEAFGGLVREEGFSAEKLGKQLLIDCQSDVFQPYANEIWEYINTAKPSKK